MAARARLTDAMSFSYYGFAETYTYRCAELFNCKIITQRTSIVPDHAGGFRVALLLLRQNWNRNEKSPTGAFFCDTGRPYLLPAHCSLFPAPCSLFPAPYFLFFAPCSLSLSTLNSPNSTLHLFPQSLNPLIPQSLNPLIPQSLLPTPYPLPPSTPPRIFPLTFPTEPRIIEPYFSPKEHLT